jgi:UDP-N-acetylmuramoylalanine--D-glutamate ligase
VSGALPASALVVGLARSGRAAALALARRGVRVVAADRSPAADPGRLAAAGVEIRLGSEEVSLVEGMELLVKSPGVPGESPLVAAARARGVPVWSEVELAYRLLPAIRLAGVTGTKGKTTTTQLLGAMLGAPTAGNVGTAGQVALTELDGQVAAGDWVVCELSSFQLEDIDALRPDVAVLLNLEEDHIDRHGTVAAYHAAKLRIFENQGEGDTAVVPRGFGSVPGGARRVEFGWDDPLPAEPRIPGAHNRGNAVAAALAATAAGAGEAQVADALRSFGGVPHRLELVRERAGVRWVNDSIATNTLAVRRALAAYDAPLRVILGGRAKGESWDRLAAEARGRVARAYLIGEAAEELAGALAAAGVDHEQAGDLEHAVAAAARDAGPGDVVLLSPACASYDQFRNFEERGDAFRALVDALP